MGRISSDLMRGRLNDAMVQLKHKYRVALARARDLQFAFDKLRAANNESKHLLKELEEAKL